MGFSTAARGERGGEAEAARGLLTAVPPDAADGDEPSSPPAIAGAGDPPEDAFHLAYVLHFLLGFGVVLPWNAFITAVDYFSFLYPAAPVDRVFAVAYMPCGVLLLVLLVLGRGVHRASARLRINAGLALFVLALLAVPVMDAVYVKGRKGLYGAFDVTVGAVMVAGISDALVEGGIIGVAGELPRRYMQAAVAGTSASGVFITALRIVTKAIYPRDAYGLRKSANLYFGVGIATMVICVVSYNVADRLPVVQYYRNIKMQALKEEKNFSGGSAWRSTLWDTFRRIKCFAFGVFLAYLVSLSIFPGFITEDMHSEALKDWYPIILIAGYNVFDLVGKSLTAIYVLEDANVAVAAGVARLLFYPLYLVCLHGPKFFRTEIPVMVLTCLLGLTNGYLVSSLLMLAPKAVPIQHAETAGIVTLLFLHVGLASGSIMSWFWVV